jgi:hypothetical protein
VGQLALGVVELLGAVDAGAQLDPVGDQEVELLVVHEREVADHRELQLLAELAGAAAGVLADVADDGEVDERLTALKLEGDEGAGAAQGQLDGLLGRLRGHVRVDLIHVGARGVAVDAGLVAAQGDDEDVQVGAGVEEAVAGLDGLGGLAHVVAGAHEVARGETREEVAGGVDGAAGEAGELVL